MPSERFFHLPEEKKRRIKKAALKEFARVPLEEISINRIIRDAEIPRGSFYQYFEDKQDLQTFLLEDFRDRLKKELEEYLIHKKGDMFQLFEDSLKEIVRIGMESEFKAVCKNAFSRMKYHSSCKENPFRKEGKELVEKILAEMKQDFYPEYTMEEIHLVLDILMQIFKEALVRIFLLEEEQDTILENYHKKLVLIEAGMKTEKEKETKNAEV